MYTTCIQGVSTVLPPLIFEYSHEYGSFRIPSRALKGFRIYLDPFSFVVFLYLLV